ncbi:hypothetical protein F2Q69_00049390 [Brassica cretica]|uniref:Uncharacterized protein n=1 Tax=Brassica cretica TaxID=69181 RepID=A0A8S9PXA5_BRACR|nr:hypothetical protein F2Q69_00049390 [Brassica cretica]
MNFDDSEDNNWLETAKSRLSGFCVFFVVFLCSSAARIARLRLRSDSDLVALLLASTDDSWLRCLRTAVAPSRLWRGSVIRVSVCSSAAVRFGLGLSCRSEISLLSSTGGLWWRRVGSSEIKPRLNFPVSLWQRVGYWSATWSSWGCLELERGVKMIIGRAERWERLPGATPASRSDLPYQSDLTRVMRRSRSPFHPGGSTKRSPERPLRATH